MNLYLIRHAEPIYDVDTITENGHKQAEKLAEWLKDIKVDELYHSSMERARLTAEYLARKWNISATSIDWARELSWGKSNGDAGNALSPWAINERIVKNEHYYPAGNSWRDLPELKEDKLIQDIDNHCKALDEFLSEHGYVRENQLYKAVSPNDKTIVIVCHGGVISTLVSYLANVPFWQYIAHMGSDLTAVTKIHLRGNKDDLQAAQLLYINSQAHLGIK